MRHDVCSLFYARFRKDVDLLVLGIDCLLVAEVYVHIPSWKGRSEYVMQDLRVRTQRITIKHER